MNTHAPETRRLDAAWGAGHIVLSLRIRDLVEEIVFSEGRGAVPDDAVLREMLRGRRFRLCGRERVPESVEAVWKDLNLSAYAMSLRCSLRTAYKEDFRCVVSPLLYCVDGPFSDVDESRALFRPFYDMFHSPPADESGETAWVASVMRAAEDLSRPMGVLTGASDTAEDLLDQFRLSDTEPLGVRRLRYSVCAVWYLRKKWMQWFLARCTENMECRLEDRYLPRFYEADEKGLL